MIKKVSAGAVPFPLQGETVPYYIIHYSAVFYKSNFAVGQAKGTVIPAVSVCGEYILSAAHISIQTAGARGISVMRY